MSETPTFFDQAKIAIDAASVQNWEIETAIRGVEGFNIGMLYLKDGQSLFITVDQGVISRDGEKIADIPSLLVLETPESLTQHIQDSTGWEVDRLETL